MAIYQIQNDALESVPQTTFAAAGIRERQDLQRFLRDRIEVISPDTLVIAEEFGEWEDSKRRIDLLGIDKSANLVVIELKRTEVGGVMELQAIRYAAMVSTLTFARAVDVFANYLKSRNDDRDAEQLLLEFLEWDDATNDDFASDVRIVLASAEFSRELTSSVLWLADHGIDIRCVRIRPYSDRDRVLLDVQQVIPLPEAEDYQIRVREKRQEERVERQSKRDMSRFNVTIGGVTEDNLPKRRAIHKLVMELCRNGISPDEIGSVIDWRKNLFASAPGNYDSATFVAVLKQRDGAKFDEIRWFLEEDELIHYDSNTFALTSQWGIRTPTAMRELLDRFQLPHVSFEKVS